LQTRPGDPATPSKNWKKTILAVDDEPMILDLLGMAMRSVGYVFLQAEDGVGCLGKLKEGYEPDIIILDLSMPGIDGLETCRRIRAQYPDVNAPIIFLTAKNTQGDLANAQAAGGDDFIIKPFQIETVLRRVEFWLSKGRKRKPVGRG
jgi:DNA-binding response OmpR family regulator